MKISDIEGIGPAFAKKLVAAGVRSTDKLLKVGATRKGREALAAKSGIAAHTILEWVNRADLYRIKGVGSEFSDLLEAAGVDTVVELAQRNAANLAAAFKKLLTEKPHIVRRVPGEKQIAGWVQQARLMPRMVEY